MAKPTAQACHAMTTYFINKYTEVVGKAPSVNRNASRYLWEGMLMDYSPTDARTLVDFYLDKYEKPVLQWFLYNYEKVDENKKDKEQENARLAARRKATQERLDEWRKRWQK